jgi:hypothetical protein
MNMAGLLDEPTSPINKLIALARAAGLLPQGDEQLDDAYHRALVKASHNALAGHNPGPTAGMGANMLASPPLAKMAQGGMDPAVQAWFAQTAAGRSGFGSGAAYGCKDLGQNF